MGEPVSRARLVVAALPDAGETCRLEGREAAHARARRLAAGDAVVLVDGTGREAPGSVLRVGRTFLEIAVASVRSAAAAGPAPIRLFVAAVRSERLAWIVEKATELGAASVTLLVSQRTQRFRAIESVAERLDRVARAAAKQAERADWPRIAGPIALADALAGAEGGTRLVLDPSGEPFPATLPAVPTALFVGPEGGWTEAELEQAIRAGGLAVSLAAGKLRAETAAVAALTLARTALARVPH